MRALILAAGRGSRMNTYTDTIPKCLLKINGKSLLEIQLDSIRNAGITDIGIITGYKKELIEKYSPISFYNADWQSSNMVSSLACASSWLEKDICIVSYSDIFYDKSAIISLIKSESDLAITYDTKWLELWSSRFKNPLEDAESFRFSPESNLLIEIGNKVNSIDEIQGQYMGLLRITPKGWNEIQSIRTNLSKTERDKLHMTGTLQKIIENRNLPISVIPYSSNWGEVDTEDDLKLYNIS
jgi:choline kinase